MRKPFAGFLLLVEEAGRRYLSQLSASSAVCEEKSLVQSCHDLLGTSGEASGSALAREVLDKYYSLNKGEKCVFFAELQETFSSIPSEISAAIEAYRNEPSDETLMALSVAAETPRQELFRRLNSASGGTESLVNMRSDLQHLLVDYPQLKGVDYDMRHLFVSWFNRGFLRLHEINWNTPAKILEKLIAYESVHEFQDWRNLRRRLADDRRCFAFFHPALPDEPLIFVQIALVKGIASKVQPLLDSAAEVSDPAEADTAIFYSISNCQMGLRGISFGNFLIKQVVVEIAQEFPKIRTYSTLSPIPGFRAWLRQATERADVQTPVICGRKLNDILDDSEWVKDPKLAGRLKPHLIDLCSHYLARVKMHGKPADPVARFHLSNGAFIERLNWLGDVSANGLRLSAGMMVNYLYEPSQIVHNHEKYVMDGVVAMSDEVAAILGDADMTVNQIPKMA